MLSRGCCRRCVFVMFGAVDAAFFGDVHCSWQASAVVCPGWWRAWRWLLQSMGIQTHTRSCKTYPHSRDGVTVRRKGWPLLAFAAAFPGPSWDASRSIERNTRHSLPSFDPNPVPCLCSCENCRFHGSALSLTRPISSRTAPPPPPRPSSL